MKNLILELWPKILSINQIVVFFIVNISLEGTDWSFLHEVNHQGKVGFESTSYDWVRPVVPLTQLDCRISWSCKSLERINWCLCLTIVTLSFCYLFPCIFLSKLVGSPFSSELIPVLLSFIDLTLSGLKNDLELSLVLF